MVTLALLQLFGPTQAGYAASANSLPSTDPAASIPFSTDFNSAEEGTLPAGWTLLEDAQVQPRIVSKTDGQALKFPAADGANTGTYLLLNDLSLPGSFSLGIKLTFPSPGSGKAGLLLGADPAMGGGLAVMVNPADGSLDVFATTEDPNLAGIQVLPLRDLVIQANQPVWLGIEVNTTDGGSTLEAFWSTDGNSYELILTADEFNLPAGVFGLGTRGKNSAAALFDDVWLTSELDQFPQNDTTLPIPAITPAPTLPSANLIDPATLLPQPNTAEDPSIGETSGSMAITSLPADFGKTFPASGATGFGSQVVLSWNPTTDATSYEVCYDKTNDNLCSTWSSTGTLTSKTLSGLSSNVSFYWQVRAVNSLGTTYANGTPGEFWSFKTGLPAAFAKLSPLNSAPGQSLTPTLSWSASSGAAKYYYCYDTVNDNKCSAWIDNGTNTSKTLGGLTENSTYYWHVKATNNFGTTQANGSSTAFWSFKTGLPAAFSKSSPADGAGGQGSSATLRWAVSSGATSYEVCFDSSDDDSCASWENVGTTTSKDLSGLTDQTSYFWQVRAINELGAVDGDGQPTAFWSFTTGVPAAFGKGTPLNGSVGLSNSVTLSWAASPGAARYEICTEPSDDGACAGSWIDNGDATSRTIDNLTDQTIYTWQVRALNDFGEVYANGSNAEHWSFTTGAPADFGKTSPANTLGGQSSTPTLTWEANPGATSYELCYDNTNDNACATWTSTGTATSKTLSGMLKGTVYYWQVRALNSFGTTPANGSETAFWAFTAGAPVPFTKSAPVTTSTGQALNTTLSWTASPGATKYEACFDKTNDNKCSTWVNTGTNTSRTLSGLLTNTTYYWQVRATNNFGIVYANGSSSNYWNFKTGMPAAFVKTSPANGAAGQPTNPSLNWGTSTGAAKYEVCYDSSNDNACSSWIDTGNSTSLPLSGLAAETTYYWQARAINSVGTTYANGSATTFWSFTTGVPLAFSKSTPVDGSTSHGDDVTVSWAESTGATSYAVCLASSLNDDCADWQDNGTSTSKTYTGLAADTTYYWQVKANNSVGSTFANGDEYALWSFITSGPAAFGKTALANGTSGQSASATLRWEASPGATSYEVCFDTSDDNQCDSVWESTGAVTSKTLTSLASNTSYFWQTRARNGFGLAYANGSPDAFWSFSTGAPTSFDKLSPTSGALGQPGATVLSWQPISGATKYEVCFDKTNDNACSTWSSTGTSTTKTLSGLSSAVTYYWQVRATNEFGTTYANGANNAYWSFKTGKPTAFNRVLPETNSIGQPVRPTFSWTASPGATSYSYCFDKTNDSKCSAWVNNGTATSVLVNELTENSVYYWHVRASNNYGTTYGNNSSTAYWKFTTGLLPTAFQKVSLMNATSGQATSANLAWSASTVFDRYELCHDTTNDNACTLWQDIGTATSVDLVNLAPNTTYYWQVRAVNSTGSRYANGSAAQFWSFTTGPLPGTFKKLTPAKASTDTLFNTTLSWGASIGAMGYEVCYDDSNDAACVNWQDNGTNTSRTLEGLAANTTYYWQVRAINTVGVNYANGFATNYWSFTTGSMPAAFEKTSLANGSTGIANNPTLAWQGSSLADTYEVCFDSTDDDTCADWADAGTFTSLTLPTLTPNTIYFWQVRAVNKHGATYANGTAGDDWTFTTQPVPATFGKLSPGNSATGQAGSLSLTWETTSPVDSYQICTDNSDDGACAVWVDNGTSTSYPISGLALDTITYWQVRAINSFGTTHADGSSNAFWGFSTGAPAAFSKINPELDSVGQSGDPTMLWEDVSGATSYQYCYDTTNDNNCATWLNNGDAASVDLSGLAKDTTYYWQVRATNNFGTTYANANDGVLAHWWFNTGSPSAFHKLTIADGTLDQPANPTLRWEESYVAKYYELCLDTTNNNACDTTWQNIGRVTSLALSGLSPDTTYTWQVRAVNSFGTTPSDGGDEAFWTFTTGSAPASFFKVALADGVEGRPFDVTLQWGTSAHATRYEFCYDTSNDNACLGWIPLGLETSRDLTGLSPLTTYYWQVRAVNSFRAMYANSSASSFWSFKTGAVPDGFSKTAPVNGVFGQPSNATLRWAASDGATSYEYCVDSSNDNACSTWLDNGASTTISLTGLVLDTTYYWQVRARNIVGITYANGGPSVFWAFTASAPTAFNKISPVDDATGQPDNTVLTWAVSTGATNYQYCIDKTDDNACTTWLDTGTATSAQLHDLEPDTSFYWQVRAVNNLGTTYASGDPTAFHSFTTGAPAAFGKGLPTFGAVGQPSSPTLSWEASSGATKYEVCTYTNDTPTRCDVSANWTDNGTATYMGLSSLPTDTLHYWQVRAVNSFGTTYADASALAFWNFNTGTPSPYAGVQQKLAAGYYHNCAVVAGGAVKCWGNNNSGQLGFIGGNSMLPVAVAGITNAIAVSAGSWHSCALVNGTIQCWGRNFSGVASAPWVISGISTAVSISSGRDHTCALLNGGAIKCWGQNGSGQLGNGSLLASATPVTVLGISTATSVSAGADHTCATLEDGTARCWGKNSSGQLGNGSTTDSSTPVVVSGLANASVISAAEIHTCALVNPGVESTVSCWGSNAYGQLGDGTTSINPVTTPVTVPGISNVGSLAAGGKHTCVRSNYGAVQCWGRYYFGVDDLENQIYINDLSPVAISGFSGISITLASGQDHSCVIANNRSIQCFGANKSSQLGFDNSADPVNLTPGIVINITNALLSAILKVGLITA